MPEQRNIKFDTIYDQRNDTKEAVVQIAPEVNLPCETLVAKLNQAPQVMTTNNIPATTGELLMVMRNQIDDSIDFEINDRGELIVHGEHAQQYSINADHDLIYKETVITNPI